MEGPNNLIKGPPNYFTPDAFKHYAAITISPKVDDSPLKEQLKKWFKRFVLLKCKIRLWPEIAVDKDMKPRLHFHGVIDAFHLEDLNKDMAYLKEICFICVKKIDSWNKWLAYCRKELDKTKWNIFKDYKVDLEIDSELIRIYKLRKKEEIQYKNTLLPWVKVGKYDN